MRGRKVELEYQVPSEAAASTGLTTVWSGKRRISGVLHSVSASERFTAGKDTVYATHRFVCLAQPALDPDEKGRFVKTLDGQVYEVVYFNDIDELGRQWEFDLLEVK